MGNYFAKAVNVFVVIIYDIFNYCRDPSIKITGFITIDNLCIQVACTLGIFVSYCISRVE